MHRLKHIPTGLYYSPYPSKLTTGGKVYTSNNDALAYFSGSVMCRISKSMEKKLIREGSGHLIFQDSYKRPCVRVDMKRDMERELI